MVKPPLVVIVGPTAVGKTDISIRLAERLNGEIVSADSRLFYRGMDIGTAKPTAEQRARIPHHLIDVASPSETWSLSIFQKAAAAAIADIQQRGKIPFLVGGTGQYVHAVTHGWTPPPAAPEAHLRAALEAMAKTNGSEWLHDRLESLDPNAAMAIDARNLRRTIRALEVILITGRKFSEQRNRAQSPYRLLTIGLNRPRPELYDRLDARIEAMFAAGFLDEVRTLLDNGYSPSLPAMSAIGYRQGSAVLLDGLEVQEAIAQMKRATRVFVRRQANWFKNDDLAIHWFDAGKTPLGEIEAYLRSNLNN